MNISNQLQWRWVSVPRCKAQKAGVRPKTRFNFLGPGFSIDYTGPMIPYYNYIKLSPAGLQIYCIKDDLCFFNFSRESILADLLAAVQKTKAEVLAGTLALGDENTSDEVKVRVRTKSGEQSLEVYVVSKSGTNWAFGFMDTLRAMPLLPGCSIVTPSCF